MAVITFSRQHPIYSQYAGQPTWFVEKILKAFDSNELRKKIFDHGSGISVSWTEMEKARPKKHTIRVGDRWKAGDKFTPRYWGDDVNPKSKKKGPYHSKQITFADDITIKETYRLTIYADGSVQYNGPTLMITHLGIEELTVLALNDGLTYDEFYEWLIAPCVRKKKVVRAQIICWQAMDYDNIFQPF